MVEMPEIIRIAFEEGYGRSYNQPVQMTYPPGVTSLEISPAFGVWYVFGFQYGEIDPGPPTVNMIIYWEQRGIRRFPDAMIHAVMDHPYPMCVTVTRDNPLLVTVINLTGVNQTIDTMSFIALFDDMSHFIGWKKELGELGLRVPPPMLRAAQAPTLRV